MQSALPSNITPAYLTTNVENVNAAAFNTEYGFTFPLTGSSTNKDIVYWKAFFEFDSLNPSEGDIEKKVKEQLLEFSFIYTLLHSGSF